MAIEVPPRKKAFPLGVAILIAILALAAFVVVPFLPILKKEESADGLYKFKPGTTWTYEETCGATKKRRTVAVTKLEDGKVWMESKSQDAGAVATATCVRYVENGYLVEAPLKDGALQHAFRLYRLNSVKGQTWETDPQSPDTSITMRHLGITSIQVRAGAFRNVINIRKELKTSVIDLYLAPGAGVVKEEEKIRQIAEVPLKTEPPLVSELIQFVKAP